MLYVTTRNITDVHTAHRAMTNDRGTDAGQYVPFRFPRFSPEEIGHLKEQTFGQSISHLLQVFFGVHLENSEVDFTIGRQPVRLVPLAHKIVAGEPWRNPDWEFLRMARSLATRLQGQKELVHKVPGWTEMAVRVAVLFGLHGELQRMGCAPDGRCVDFTCEAGDLSWAVSAIYARKMGLPIGNVICSCRENDPLWELLRAGQIRAKALTPFSQNMERLIFHTLGVDVTRQYLLAAEKDGLFILDEQQCQLLRRELSLVVVSQNRAGNIIPNVYKTGGYVLSVEAALAYGGLLDFRSGSPERRAALLLSERGPSHEAEAVAAAMNVSLEELKTRLHIK